MGTSYQHPSDSWADDKSRPHSRKRAADGLDAQQTSSLEEPHAKRVALQSSPDPAIKQEANEDPPKRLLKRKECTLCCIEVALNRFPKAPHAGHEQHGRNVCFKCWEQHLQVELNNKEWNNISCPECDKALEEHEIKKLDTSFVRPIYERWLDKAAKECLATDEEYRACPSADCSWGCFMSTRDDGNIFRCQVCHYRYCITCEAPMHEDMACDQYQAELRLQEQQEQEKLSAEKVRSISKPCPKCKINLDKYTGCDHVTCMLPKEPSSIVVLR